MISIQYHIDMIFLRIFKSRLSILRSMSWVAVGAIILAALGIYALSKKEQPKCPYCGAYVSVNAPECKNCNTALGWA